MEQNCVLVNIDELHKLAVKDADHIQNLETCISRIENVVNWLIDTLPANCENLKEYYDSILKMIQEVNNEK